MAPGVKVLQVESVVPGLVEVRGAELRFAALELDREDGRADDENGVDAAAEARHLELEEQRSRKSLERGLEELDFRLPRAALAQIDVESARRCQVAENGLGTFGEEGRNRCGVVRGCTGRPLGHDLKNTGPLIDRELIGFLLSIARAVRSSPSAPVGDERRTRVLVGRGGATMPLSEAVDQLFERTFHRRFHRDRRPSSGLWPRTSMLTFIRIMSGRRFGMSGSTGTRPVKPASIEPSSIFAQSGRDTFIRSVRR